MVEEATVASAAVTMPLPEMVIVFPGGFGGTEHYAPAMQKLPPVPPNCEQQPRGGDNHDDELPLGCCALGAEGGRV